MRLFIILACSAWSAAALDFNTDVRPILAKNCFACHGRDAEAREAKLRLDVAGDVDFDELIARISTDDPDEVMPPPKTGHALGVAEVATLEAWILAGAVYQQHWSFVAPKKGELPAVKQPGWPQSAIDHFILAKLEDAGMAPSPEADRSRLLRRVSLDLIGLPPTPEETAGFVEDTSPKAFETVVKRLLSSQHFGEHWARMWLDLARYADTKGYEKDKHRDIWRYRDWVIQALNADMPYDQFTREQLAGDLLPNRSTDQLLATAFHRNTMTNDEGGTDNEEFRVAAVKDRVDTTMQVWMGLTMGCAKCHTHKYDPISIEDYYSFYAYFNQTQDADNEAPFGATPTLAQSAELAKLDAAQKPTARSADFAKELATWRAEIARAPLWQALKLAEFASKHDVRLEQQADSRLVAVGPRPQKDTWTITLDLPPGTHTSLRIEHFPKAIGGGDWPDANVAIRELSAELIVGGKARKLTLVNPRATFSQRRWEVAKALDGKLNAGWAISPKFAEPQTSVFDFKALIDGAQLRLTLEQEYGQGLLLARSRFSVSSYPTAWLQAELKPDLARVFADHVHPETSAQAKTRAAAKKKADALRRAIPKTPVMQELAADKQRKTQVHTRGNFLDQGAEVVPRVPGVFGAFPADAPANRLGVARWLMQAENPLTARVMVNRIWARLFGIGLVETEEDFGAQGLMPSHPALLDWLAVDFREQGWSLKQLLGRLVHSRTYRQQSSASAEQLAQDPRNRLIGRGPRFRLPAETVRDQALAVSGLLTPKIGGPSVMPPQPAGVWKSTYSGNSWQNATGPDRYRRGLYTYRKRTSPYPAMITFDGGSGEVCQIRRVRTNTPLQALVTLNDPAFLEAAGALAARMTGEDLEARIATGFRLVLVRTPHAQELVRLVSFYKYLQLDDEAAFLKSAGIVSGDARMVALASVLLNLDETVMKP
ncbi:MAG: hypothetical protein ACI8W8_000004 [Rhodothermales bacterium]|jgi:hypothetical protein